MKVFFKVSGPALILLLTAAVFFCAAGLGRGADFRGASASGMSTGPACGFCLSSICQPASVT